MPYYVYIITNKSKRSFYIGVTFNLRVRMSYHIRNVGTSNSWAGHYRCQFLVYYESFKYINDAILSEKQLKGWSRKKKEWLIRMKNPDWEFLEIPC